MEDFSRWPFPHSFRPLELNFLTFYPQGGTPDILATARHVLTDWNHQKIPYLSVPPAIHPSLIPSTIPSAAGGNAGAVIAPGAETVGQAQILTEFSKPFELAGLFGVADAGAFGSESEDTRAQEVIMDDNSVDPARLEAVMEADDSAVRLPVKRSHSPGPEFEPECQSQAGVAQRPTSDGSLARTPKRLRKAKDLSAYEEAAAKSHPLSRKTLKRDAKRARRAAARLQRRDGEGANMEVEVDELQNTFMTGIES